MDTKQNLCRFRIGGLPGWSQPLRNGNRRLREKGTAADSADDNADLTADRENERCAQLIAVGAGGRSVSRRPPPLSSSLLQCHYLNCPVLNFP